VDPSKLFSSQSVQFVQTRMKPERRPHIVTIDWLFDCIEKGELLDVNAGNYLVKVAWWVIY